MTPGIRLSINAVAVLEAMQEMEKSVPSMTIGEIRAMASSMPPAEVDEAVRELILAELVTQARSETRLESLMTLTLRGQHYGKGFVG